MNNAFFQKWMEKVKKHRDIKVVTIEKMRNYLVSQPHYHTTKFVSNGKKKTEILMNKPVCLGLSILELNKTWALVWLCETKYDKKVKLHDIDICIHKKRWYFRRCWN